LARRPAPSGLHHARRLRPALPLARSEAIPYAAQAGVAGPCQCSFRSRAQAWRRIAGLATSILGGSPPAVIERGHGGAVWDSSATVRRADQIAAQGSDTGSDLGDGRQARRPARRTADQVRVRHQPANRQAARYRGAGGSSEKEGCHRGARQRGGVAARGSGTAGRARVADRRGRRRGAVANQDGRQRGDAVWL
jgi:hypothetical protein